MEEHRLAKKKGLEEIGCNPYINYFKSNSDIAEILKEYGSHTHDELDALKPVCTVAGRIIAIRSFGKVSFLTLRDRTGEIQTYVRKGVISDEGFALFSHVEVGDFVAVTGYLFITKTGELTVCSSMLTVLTKALRSLPEKWHGLKDIETRHRMRYLDLIVNRDVADTFKKRSLIIHLLREFFHSKGFLEVETPMMHQIAGGATARPFVTHHKALKIDLFLRIAPELYLKRLVVGGLERVFEINRSFRNEGLSLRHNPEFTMLEWYMAYNDYNGLMDMLEDIFVHVANVTNGKAVGFMETDDGLMEIDLTPPWPRITMTEAVVKYTDIDRNRLSGIASLKVLCEEYGVHTEAEWREGKLISELFEKLVERKLVSPTFITDHPKEISPLAKSKFGEPEITERFELFIGGIELANGFNELNDPIDQKIRFEEQMVAREKGNEEAQMIDYDYINALEYGLPPTAGAGLGIDRFVMLLCGKKSIREVILFPQMRPEVEVQTAEE
jgi:lysyl-tRNA synthetase class 2